MIIILVIIKKIIIILMIVGAIIHIINKGLVYRLYTMKAVQLHNRSQIATSQLTFNPQRCIFERPLVTFLNRQLWKLTRSFWPVSNQRRTCTGTYILYIFTEDAKYSNRMIILFLTIQTMYFCSAMADSLKWTLLSAMLLTSLCCAVESNLIRRKGVFFYYVYVCC